MQSAELIGRLIISLGVVIGLIWVIARKMRGGARRRLRSNKLIDVLGRQNLTRSSSVAVIRVADQALIVGVTDASVRVLGDIELDAVQAKIADTDPSTRRGAGSNTGADPTVPPNAAALEGTLTDADIEALRSDRARRRQDLMADTASPQRGGPRTAAGGALSGSALSPATWRQTLDALRDMTARKG